MTPCSKWFAPALVAFLCGCGSDSHVLATRSGSKPTVSPDGGGGAPGTAPSSGGAPSMTPMTGGAPPCTPSASSETNCGDGVDDDCDGYIDCLDSDCAGKSCDGAGALTCTAGACLGASDGGLPALPPLDNVHVTQRGDTTIVDFEPVAAALDYRIYPMPANGDILVGANGELSVKNAIYRCSGDRPFMARKDDTGALYDASLTGGQNGNLINNYVRSPSDAVLGYVYLTPGDGRQPVYKLSDPNSTGGFMNASYLAPIYSEASLADYVVGTDARDKLIAGGFRDDGIQFYVDANGMAPIYRKLYTGLWNGNVSVFFTDGPEADARKNDDPKIVADFGTRFNVLATQAAGSVALHRVLYSGNNSFDVLAAGDARYTRVLEQGNVPFSSVTWPGLTGPTTLVVEALDEGCPFAGGYIASEHAPADSFNYPSITVDEARVAGTGEVFIDGQHDPGNRPKPIARSFINAVPAAKPQMAWFESFDASETWSPFTITSGNNGVYIYRNAEWAIDFSGCTPNLTVGPMLGQLVTGFADGGSSCNMSMVKLGLGTAVAADNFLHVTMSTEVPSTARRYPQLMITTAKVVNPGDVEPLDDVPLHARLGPLPFDTGAPPGNDQTIIVQPFAAYHQLQVEFCDQRGWGVSVQCPEANLYGDHAGDYSDTWQVPWLPVPVMGDVAGFDRPVKFDVYASTSRVYVFMDDAPAGCAVLPDGRMPAGPVTVAFRSVLYHSGIDESVVPDDSGMQYLHNYSLSHFDRHMDDFGVDLGVPAPAWDETRLPCGTRWYGGS